MSNKKTRKTVLIASVIGAHVISLLIMWWVLNSEEIIEPEFEKIISVKLTNTPSKPLPPINQTARDKIAAEKKAIEVKKEKAAKARENKHKKEKERRAAEIKKAKEQPKKKTPKKTTPKNAKPEKKTPKESQKDKLKKERDAKAAKDKLKRIRDAKAKRVRDAKAAKNARIQKERDAKAAKAAKVAYQKQQTAFGQHIYQGVKDQIGKEWKQLSFAINFNTNDEVTISITIRKDGSVANARINGKSQNSQAQKLIAILNSGNYKFTAFPSNYAQRTRTFTWTFGAKLQE
jgi:hypothetical protein